MPCAVFAAWLAIAVIAVVLASSAVVIERATSHCERCGYDLRAHVGGEAVCPECATPVPQHARDRIIRKPWLLAFAIVLLLASGFILLLMFI